MVKAGNKKGKNRKQESSDSDDGLYADGDFDPKNPFGDDEIESFHNNRDKEIMDKLKPKGKKSFHYSSDEEEVLAFDDDDDDESDDDEDGNADIPDEDEEGEEEDDDDGFDEEDDHDGLDLKGAWGSKKSAYYSGNKIQNDEDAQLEEEEARLLQEKMMKRLDTNDFGLDAFNLISKDMKMKTGDELEAKKLAAKVFGDDEDGELRGQSLEKIKKNLTEMSKQEKLDLVQQESPELFELCKEFKAKLNELNEVLLPVFECVQSEQIPRSMATDFIVYKTKLYLMYCCHLSFYFILKSNRSSIENHPIIKNILQYRNLCKIISPIDRKLEKEVAFILESLRQGKPLNIRKEDASQQAKVKKSVRFRNLLAKGKLDDLSFDEDEEDDDQAKSDEETEPMEGEEGEESKKRAINYQIEKNKGLTPKRNKMYRNPRVRNRFKARKALIKRKSIVPKVRREEKRYGGEMTGIRSNVVRAVKFK